MASLPAKSLVCRSKMPSVGQEPSGERPVNESPQEELYLFQPAEGHLAPVCLLSVMGKMPSKFETGRGSADNPWLL